MRLLFFRMIIGIIATAFIFSARAQTSATTTDSTRIIKYKRTFIKKPKPIRKEMSGGARLNSNGWGVLINRGWVTNSEERESDKFYNLKIAELEFDEVKDPKEVKHTNTYLSSVTGDRPHSYVFGKINNFYTLKFGYGFRRLIAGKEEPKNVSIHWFALGGVTLGMLKPYYLDAYVREGSLGYYTAQQIKYSDSTKESFLTDQLVIGNSGFSKGLGEMKFIPGIHAKAGLHFDFAASKKTVLAIEAGINAEVYTQKIDIMANQPSYPYKFSAFVSFQFGKRW